MWQRQLEGGDALSSGGGDHGTELCPDGDDAKERRVPVLLSGTVSVVVA